MTLLLERLLPLLALIILGFIAGRIWVIQKQSLANLVINTITPVVFFGYLARTEIGSNTFLVPLSAFCVASAGSAITYRIASIAFGSPSRNLIAFQSASGNTGYFGIPLFIALFGESSLGIYMLAIVGYMLFETTVGYYLLARGAYSVRASVGRIFRLPPIYAMIAGLLFAASGRELPGWFADVLSNFRGTYIVIGMMMIGLALADTKSFRLSAQILTIAALGKFLLVPSLMAALLWLEGMSAGVLEASDRRALLVYSFVPPAANSVAYAIQLQVLPEEAALNLLLLTVLGFLVVVGVSPILLRLP